LTNADLIDKALIFIVVAEAVVVVVAFVVVDCFAEYANRKRCLCLVRSCPHVRPRQGVGHGDGQAVDQGAAGAMDCFNFG